MNSSVSANSASTSQPRALVVGLGIGGLASAIRLSRIGWDVTIVERSRQRRRGGYFVALFRAGALPADRLGMRHLMHDRASQTGGNWDIDRAGNKSPGLGYNGLTGGNDIDKIGDLIIRGDIENAGYDALPQNVTVRFATSPVSIEQDPDGVDVTLQERDSESTTTERFELVVGADGIHSTVRRLAFGIEEKDVLVPTGYMIAACTLDSPVPGYKMQDSLILSEINRSCWVFAFEDHNPTLLFSYKADDLAAEKKRNPIDSIKDAFASKEGYGETLSWLIDQFEQADEFLFDSADQVHMDSWHRGRVVLMGDAAWCLTLYSGMGASSAIAGSDALGTFLERNGNDVQRSLSQWENHMRPFIKKNMKSGMDMRSFFTVGSQKEATARKVRTKLMKSRLMEKFGTNLRKRAFASKIQDIAAEA